MTDDQGFRPEPLTPTDRVPSTPTRQSTAVPVRLGRVRRGTIDGRTLSTGGERVAAAPAGRNADWAWSPSSPWRSCQPSLAAGGTAALVAGPLAPAGSAAPAAPAAAAVANSAERRERDRRPGPDRRSSQPSATRSSPSRPRGSPRAASAQIPSTGVGSGVVLTADGYILTNKHVVAGSQSLTVELSDERQFPATIVKQSDDKDLALIKIDATGLHPATIGDSSAAPGRPDG